ncbi:chemotaxis protein CheB [Clostridium sp. WILCCON 0269]|uniref:protein-glutamate methylesterase n=1 Tax=Candidatus Clostridium eludens TaxID=3381663 RepID=A0ABW8SND9_9CLOT
MKFKAVAIGDSANDGSEGLKCIKEYGGITIVQDLNTAEANQMPLSALEKIESDYVLHFDEISIKLIELVGGANE